MAVIPILLTLQALSFFSQNTPSLPKTQTIDFHETLHGIEIADPYRWLEDGGSPETKAWIETQNTYTQAMLASFPGKETIRQRLTSLCRIQEFSLPSERKGQFFFTMRLAGQELPSIYFKRTATSKPEVLVDPNRLSNDSSISVSLLDISADGSLLAYGVRSGGQDETEVNLLNVKSGEKLPDRLPKARYYGVSISANTQSLYYSRYTSDGPRVYVHSVGKDPSEEMEVFGKGYGPDKIIVPMLSEDSRYLLLTVLHGSAGKRTELYVQDLARQSPMVTIVNDIPSRFVGKIAGNQLFLQTNWQAPRGRLVVVDLNNPARNQWKEIVPASNVVIQGFALAGGKLFVNYLENVVPQIRIVTPEGKRVRELKVPDLGTVSEISGRWDSNKVFYSFESSHIPKLVFRYEVSAGEQYIWGKTDAPINSDQFAVKQVWYESKDKTRVPMFLMYSPNQILDGNNPTLLTGYGGFNLAFTPVFSPLAVVWVENGGILALPNLRGGGEFGEDWHQAGMLEKKQNVFDDFIAAAEWLIKKGYTRAEPPGNSGWEQRGLASRGCLDTTPGTLPGSDLSLPTARHAALPQISGGPILDFGVRLGR